MLRISITTNAHFTRMVKGESMSLIHNMNDRVSGAIQALAELHKAGFIEDVAYYRYTVSSLLKHEGVSYESVVLSRRRKDLTLPFDCYADPSILFDEIEIIAWKDLRGIVPRAPKGWTAVYAHLDMGWFELLRMPITHWAYCEKDPRPWAAQASE